MNEEKNSLLKALLALYLRAETDIVNELARLRAQGLADYHAEAALERVQGILQKMQNESFVYIPQMVEREFYVHNPEARRFAETVEKHISAYNNALSLGSMALAEQLSADLAAKVLQASSTVQQTLTNTLIGHSLCWTGRREPDMLAAVVRQGVAYNQVMGLNSLQNIEDLIITLQQQGITAFVDKA
ncbi:MAG: minor capsid protein, partial [Firmicutes bacterium]|nr:minor capsid protein [Bacillota bacterium]